MLGVVGAELGRGQPAGLLPFREQLPATRVHEQLPEVVAGRFGDRADIAEHHARGAIPGQVVPAAPDAPSRDWRRGSRRGDGAWGRLARPAACRPAPPRRARAGSGGCARRASAATPWRSPRTRPLRRARRGPARATCTTWCPHPPTGDLLATQAGGAAAPAAGKPHVLGLDARAPPAQEVGELGPASLAVAVLTIRPARSVGGLEGFSALGCHVHYQDKPLSCTWIRIVAH